MLTLTDEQQEIARLIRFFLLATTASLIAVAAHYRGGPWPYLVIGWQLKLAYDSAIRRILFTWIGIVAGNIKRETLTNPTIAGWLMVGCQASYISELATGNWVQAAVLGALVTLLVAYLMRTGQARQART